MCPAKVKNELYPPAGWILCGAMRRRSPARGRNPGGAPRIPRQVAAAAASSGAIQKRAAAAATSTDRACQDAVVNR